MHTLNTLMHNLIDMRQEENGGAEDGFVEACWDFLELAHVTPPMAKFPAIRAAMLNTRGRLRDEDYCLGLLAIGQALGYSEPVVVVQGAGGVV